MRPVLLVIAEPDGSGKTTLTARLRADHWSDDVEYVNPDEIARDQFGDWNDPVSVVKAAEWAGDRRESLLKEGKGIAFETVLSMRDKVEFIRRARARGYFVRSFFVCTADPAINAARIVQRIAEGGHSVPIEKVAARYERSMANLPQLIKASDRTYVFDNSAEGDDARLCARCIDGRLRKTYGALPAWVADVCAELPRAADVEQVPEAR